MRLIVIVNKPNRLPNHHVNATRHVGKPMNVNRSRRRDNRRRRTGGPQERNERYDKKCFHTDTMRGKAMRFASSKKIITSALERSFGRPGDV
jgi:hypothetical protein